MSKIFKKNSSTNKAAFVHLYCKFGVSTGPTLFVIGTCMYPYMHGYNIDDFGNVGVHSLSFFCLPYCTCVCVLCINLYFVCFGNISGRVFHP